MIIFQIDVIYSRVELERKLCYHIVHVTDDMKPLVTTLVCEGTIKFFFITQEVKVNYKGKKTNKRP